MANKKRGIEGVWPLALFGVAGGGFLLWALFGSKQQAGAQPQPTPSPSPSPTPTTISPPSPTPSPSPTPTPSPTIIPPTPPPTLPPTPPPPPAPVPVAKLVGGKYVAVNLVTWANPTDYQTKIDYNLCSEIRLFHVYPVDDAGHLVYDGTAVNPATVISYAHQRGTRVTLSFGGAGIDKTRMDRVLSNPTVRDTVITGLINEVAAKGYDGITIDIEGFPPVNAVDGSDNKTNMINFMHILSARMKNGSIPGDRLLAQDIPAWDASGVWDIGATQNDVNTFSAMEYDNKGFVDNPTQVDGHMQVWASALSSPTKLILGLFPVQINDDAMFTQFIQYLKTAPWSGLMIWEASGMTPARWTIISQNLQ